MSVGWEALLEGNERIRRALFEAWNEPVNYRRLFELEHYDNNIRRNNMADWTQEEMDYIARELDRQAREEQPEFDEEEVGASPPQPTTPPWHIPANNGQVLTAEIIQNAVTQIHNAPVPRDINDAATDYFDRLRREFFPDLRQAIGHAATPVDHVPHEGATINYYTIEQGIEERPFRAFRVVREEHRKTQLVDIELPTRADYGSAGYDFVSPIDVLIPPYSKVLIWTDVKVYMPWDEVLKIYIRSSLATKYNIQLANQTGIVDSSYADNPENDGNIGICLLNHSEEPYQVHAGDRIAQGIFGDIVLTEDDAPRAGQRTGGFGSTGR